MAISGTDYRGTGTPADPYIPLTCDGLLYCVARTAYENETAAATDVTVTIDRDFNFTLEEEYRNGLSSPMSIGCNTITGVPNNGVLPRINGLKYIVPSGATALTTPLLAFLASSPRPADTTITNVNFSNIVYNCGVKSAAGVIGPSSTTISHTNNIQFDNCIFTALVQSEDKQCCLILYNSNNSWDAKIKFNYCSIFLRSCRTSL